MKRSRFSEEQKIRILEEIRSGRSRKEICAEHNVSSQTISSWKRKYGEMDVGEARKLRALEEESNRMKRIIAGQAASPPSSQSVTDPDGVVTSYTYNSEGERETTSRAVPGHAGSQDTKTTTAAVTRDGYNGLESTTEVIGAGDTVGIVTSRSFRSGDGMYSRQESFPDDASTSLVTTTKRIYSATDGEWTEEITSPTTFTRRTYKDGLLNSVELKEADDDSLDNLTSTTYTYDLLGRVKTTNHSRTGVTTYSGVTGTGYTPSGNLLGMKDAGNRLTTYTYDVLGRQVSVDAPDTDFGNITHTSYYPTGQVKATWGDGVYPRFYQYDEQNRMTTLHTWQDASSLDLSDGLSTAEANASATTTWSYNPSRGWLDYKRDADNKGADYTYTDAGRLETRQWARTLPGTTTRLTTTYGYDEGQLTSVTYNDSTANGGHETPDLAYTYTKFGQLDKVYRGSDLTALDSAELHADYEYDPVTFQVTSEELYQDTSVSRTLTRHYDDLLRPQSLVLGSDHKVGYGYDTAGRLNRVWHNPSLTAGVPQGSADFIYGYEDDSYGLIEEVAGPVHTVTNTWEGDRNVLDTKSNVKNTGSGTVSEYDYTVNNIGQRSTVAQSGSAFAAPSQIDWGYDSLGQVTSADHSAAAWDQAFSYDSIGNRKETVLGALALSGTANYVANTLNEYTTVPTAFAETPDYDDDGNLVKGTVPGNGGAAGAELDETSFEAATNLQWDAENRLVSITVDGETFTYDYDYLSRRISRTRSSDSLAMIYSYDGWNLLLQENRASNSTVTLARTYTWGIDLSGSHQGAGGVGGLLVAEFKNGGSLQGEYYPVYDGNGNVCQYLDDSGNLAAKYEYDSFGRTVSNSGGSARQWFRFRFSTKHRDYSTGLYYYGYRYYDPVTGRWPSRDPIGERGGVNLYGFVGNGPSYSFDVLGLTVVKPDRTAFVKGVYDAGRTVGVRMEIPSDGNESQKRYDELDRIRREAAGYGSKNLNSAGAKGAMLALQAVTKGPHAGRVPQFNLEVEYGGRVCCKDGEYRLTGPYTTGGMNELRVNGFPYHPDPNSNEYIVFPTTRSKWPKWAREMYPVEPKEGDGIIPQTGALGLCPDGWKDVGGYHSHGSSGANPSDADRRAAKNRPEFISGMKGKEVDLRVVDDQGHPRPINPDGTYER